MGFKSGLSKVFNQRAVNVVLGLSLAVSLSHGGAGLFRKLSGPESGEAKDEPTELVHRQMIDGIDALNTAYPTGDDGVWGSRDSQFTRGWFAEISDAAKENFDVIDFASDKDGSHDGLHTVLLKHKESQQLIMAVCGMEVPAEHLGEDVSDVFNSMYVLPPSLPNQFSHLVQAYDDFVFEYGEIDLVAGHSIGAMSAQLLAGGRDVKVMAFSSAGLSAGLVDQCAEYFDLSSERVLANMHKNCVSVPATMYSALGFQPGDNYWPVSAAPTNPNIIQHGSFEASKAIKDGDFIKDPNATAGALMPAGILASLGALLLAGNNILRGRSSSNEIKDSFDVKPV